MTKAVLIPGNMCDERLWDGGGGVLLRVLQAHRFTVDHAVTTRDATVTDMAERALTTDDGPLLPIGFSMGAIVAIEMARRAPERIVGLVLVGLNAAADLPERAARRPGQQDEVRAGGLERILIEELKPNYLAAQHRGDIALLNLLRDMGMTLGPDVFVRQSEALRTRDDLRPVLGTLSVPVLLACGAEDALCPPAWHECWADMIDDARLIVFEGSGHMLPLEAPDAFTEAIDRWITEKGIA